MIPKEHMERYNVDMTGYTPTLVTRREHTSGDEEIEESGVRSTIRMDAGGI